MQLRINIKAVKRRVASFELLREPLLGVKR